MRKRNTRAKAVKPVKRKTWGDIFYMNLAKGYDHGWAAHAADEYMERAAAIRATKEV